MKQNITEKHHCSNIDPSKNHPSKNSIQALEIKLSVDLHSEWVGILLSG